MLQWIAVALVAGLCAPATSHQECIESKDTDGAAYRGTHSVTKSGRTCQRWDSQKPNTHTRNPERYPDSGLEENYCRNPDGDLRPWCMNGEGTSPQWEFCDIPACKAKECIDSHDTDGAAYRGTHSVTKSGRACQRWDSQKPNTHTRTPEKYPDSGLEENYCRNPDGEPRPWCMNGEGTSPQWEFCDIPTCTANDFNLVDSDGNTVDAHTIGLLLFNGGTVCNDQFNDDSCAAACRKMGYTGCDSWSSDDLWSLQSTLPITMSKFQCSSGHWSSCSHSTSPNCDHSNDVFLRCMEPSDFSLVDADGNTVGAHTPGLLLFKGGTVCNDDQFDDNSCAAACRDLGYTACESWFSGDYWSSQSSLQITLAEFQCGRGHWDSCSHSSSHNCDHSNDVFLQCIEKPDFSVVDSDGNTVGGGVLGLLLFDGGTVCDDRFTEKSADAICREMGHRYGHVEYSSGDKWSIQSSLQITMDNVDCRTRDWSSCSYYVHGNNDCTHEEDLFISCHVDPQVFDLVDSDGNTVGADTVGLLLFNGGTVCNDDKFDDYSCAAACREMGYENCKSWFSGDHWSLQSSLQITLAKFKCRNYNWHYCLYSTLNNCDHGDDVFLSCSDSILSGV